MSWFTNIFSSGVDKVVDSVASGLDELFTSDEERLVLKNKLQMELNKFALDMESEVTDRWKSDNEHFITRLIRPISYSCVLVLFGSVVISDGNIGDFKINPSYIPVIETLLTTMTIAYFGSRGMEKGLKTWKGNNGK